jgi:hypothetical protein
MRFENNFYGGALEGLRIFLLQSPEERQRQGGLVEGVGQAGSPQ